MQSQRFYKVVILVAIFLLVNITYYNASEISESEIGVTIADTFKDDNLAACVASSLGKDTTDSITQSQLNTIRTLDCNNVNNLDGIEFLTKVYSLQLHNGKLESLDKIGSLNNLSLLILDNNQISDITPLSGLTNLDTLALQYNQISNISALSSLNKLTYLDLTHNNISNIEPISGLTNLETIALHQNQINNITPLAGLYNLKRLYIGENQISNIEPISGLTDLTYLAAQDNQISDLTPLAGLTKLDFLNVTGQVIDLGDIKNQRLINSAKSQRLTATTGDILTTGDINYDFSNGETLEGNQISLGENTDTPIHFEDTNFNGTIKFIGSNEKPIISTEGDTQIVEGSSLNIMQGTTANDREDGDLTKKIVVTNPDSFKGDGTDQVGTYKITYTVTDSDGNSVSVARAITVTAKPTISQPGDVTITEGDSLDILAEVIANDREDGDLTSIIVVSNPNDFKGDGTDAAGTYEITYTVTDSDGNSANAIRKITVLPKEIVKPINNDNADTDIANTVTDSGGKESTTTSADTKELLIPLTIANTGLNTHIREIIMAMKVILAAIVGKGILHIKVN